jgi:hypothetical protein
MNARKIAEIVVAFVFVMAIPVTARSDAGPDGLSAQPAPVSATSKAAAISKGAARQSDSIGVNGVGVGVHISIPTASLFQCPASVCNQGTANQNWPTRDDVADICYMPGTTTPWGGNWNLVLNHANNQVGFISTVFVENAGNGFNFTVC